MTGQLIRLIAKEIAGEAFEGDHFSISNRFRAEQRDQHAFVANEWPHYVDAARARMAKMLEHKGVSDDEKSVIVEELIRHSEQSQSPHARQVLQVQLISREREDVRHIDNNPQLRTVGA